MAIFKEKVISTNNAFAVSSPVANWRRNNPGSAELMKYYSGTVYAAAKKNADKVSSTELRLYSTRSTGNKVARWDKRTKRIESVARKSLVSGHDVTEVMSNEALDLLHKPNPFMSGRQFLAYTQLYLETAGICYWRIVSGETSTTPQELYLLPPHLVRVERDEKGKAISYEFGNEPIALEDVLVQTTENLFQPYGSMAGVSGVSSIFDTLALQQRITQTLTTIMNNEGRPSGILSPKGEMSGIGLEEAERWRRDYRRFMASGSGDVMVLDSDANFTPLSYKPADLAVIEIANHIIQEVAIAFQMPVMILKGTEGGSRAAYQTALQEWADGGISSRLRDLEDFLNFFYLPRFDGSENIFFCFDDPSPDLDELNQQLAAAAYQADLMLKNEARAKIGLPPVEGGDKFASELGSADLAADQSPAAADPGPAEPVETEQEIQTSPAQTLNGAQIASASAIVAAVAMGQLPRDSGIGQLQVLLNLSPEQANQIMGSVGITFFAPTASDENNQAPTEGQEAGKAAPLIALDTKAVRKPPTGKELVPILRKHFTKWEIAISRSVGKSLEEIQTKGLPTEFVPVKEWEAGLYEDVQPVIELMFADEGKKLLKRVGASPDTFAVFNKHVKTKASALALDLAQSTLDTTTKDVNAALDAVRANMAEGLEAGESVRDLTKRIETIFESASKHRAELIATTEAARSYSEGLRQAAIDSEVVKGFTWLASSDPCPLCQELDGKDIPINGDLPPLHPACVCVLEENV